MKILYFYQYFSTPKGAWGTRVYEFAKEWVEQGHEVTVVTSIYAKSDLKATKFVEEQYIDGIKLKIVNLEINNKQHFLKRIYTFILYALVSIWFALTYKADVVISSSGPITIGISGLIAKWFRKRKFVFEVRDLWPEVPIALGVINNKVLIKFAYWFEKCCYLNSDLIVSLSPGMESDIRSRFPTSNVISIPNSVNVDLFSSDEVKPLPSLFDKSVAIYTGNIGHTNNSELLYDASLILKERNIKDIVILLVGDGPQKSDLMNRKTKEENSNFEIFDLMPKQDLVNLIKNSLVSLIPLQNLAVLNHSSPNKLFESMAAEVPVIQTTQGWIKDLVEESMIGYTINSNSPDSLVEKLLKLRDDKVLRNNMAINAKKIALEEFDKKVLANNMLKSIKKYC